MSEKVVKCRRRVVWTPAQDAELRERTARGDSAAVIGRVLGFRDRQVWDRREALGIRAAKSDKAGARRARDAAHREAGYVKVTWNAEATSRLVGMIERRMRVEDIATEMGTTVAAILTKTSRLRLSTTDEVDPVVYERMVELAKAGWRASRISRQLGVDLPKVVALVGHLLDQRPLGYGRPPSWQTQTSPAST